MLRKYAHKLFRSVKGLVLETAQVAKDLFLILIPAIIVVKILQEIGAVSFISRALEPLMQTFGLPGEMAIVWTTAFVTNIYGGIAVYMLLAPEVTMNTAQMTVLCTMMLVCHALPVELALTHRVGCRFWFLGPLRFFGACVSGWALHLIYSAGGFLSQPAVILWSEQKVENTLFDWVLNQVNNLLFILLVLFCLLAIMRVLNAFGFTAFMGRLLKPLLQIMGISPKGASIAVFGLLAGITFGSGLLLAEVKKKEVPQRDIVLVLAFLSLCHSLIEDTALMFLMGAHASGILFFRLFFAILVLAVL